MAKTRKRKARRYIGVDVGGTKVLAALVDSTGEVLGRERVPTPRGASPEEVVETILEAMAGVIAEHQVPRKDLAAIGLTIPGVVDPDAGKVIVTPNMNLDGLAIGPVVRRRFRVPVVIGNDVNMGTLGEKWLGAARHARNAVGIMVGTGIGGGIIVDGKLVRGCREAAAEIGHMVVQIGGPRCGCGNYGCLEALASRTAIERDIRKAIKDGKKTVVPKLLEETDGVIRSSVLRKALKAEDKVVTKIMRRAAEVLGYGCLTVRHLLDPDVIVLGGGVIEACGGFMLPIVRDIVAADALPGARPGSYIAESELGDDAVVLGAVALAMEASGVDPVKAARRRVPLYPRIERVAFGEIAVGGRDYKTDLHILADGRVRKRRKKRVKKLYGSSHKIGPEELDRVCKGLPERLFIGAGQSAAAQLTPDGERFLAERGITVEVLETPKAAVAYNRAKGRKAAIIHVTC